MKKRITVALFSLLAVLAGVAWWVTSPSKPPGIEEPDGIEAMAVEREAQPISKSGSMEAPKEPATINVYGRVRGIVYTTQGVFDSTRSFSASVRGPDSSFDVTNEMRTATFHAALKEGDYSYCYQGPFTNQNGAVTYPIAARIERRAVPIDDGSWIHNLWLAFASHSYFTLRSNSSAAAVWPTGLREANEGRMGIRAFYRALPGSPFPAQIDYLAEGYEYFESESHNLQRVALPPPFDSGYTNFVTHTTKSTRLQGFLFPLRCEITRFGVVQENRAFRLNTLTVTQISVESFAVGTNPIAHPTLSGSVRVLVVPRNEFVAAPNGVWPRLRGEVLGE